MTGPAPQATPPTTGRPQWSSVDTDTASLLTHLSGEAPSKDSEWRHFVAVLRASAQTHGGRVHPNAVRPELADVIHPRRIGAFYRRALLEHLLIPTQLHELSTDLKSRNRGRPTRVYRFKEPTS